MAPPVDPPTPPPGASAGAAQALAQLGALWRRAPRAGRVAALAVAAVVLAGVAWIAVGRGGERWTTLVEGTSREDAAELIGVLDARGIPVRLRDGGRTVQVPDAQAATARVTAAAAGLPRGGTGFELFDGQSLGQSSFTEQINYRRALQGELARSIAALAQVESARVHIAMGKRSVFKDADEPPSASVALRVGPGQVLSDEAVRGIQQLVAASVDGLRQDAVVVIDQHGEVLGTGAQGKGGQVDLEQTIAARVRAMLERVVGPGRVAVVASTLLDERKVDQTEELYDKDGAVLRSEARTVEGAQAPAAAGTNAGGVAGVQGNLPGAAAGGGGATGTDGRLQETKNYELSRVVRRTIEPERKLTRLQLAIMVDYKAGVDGEEPTARDQAELDQLAAIAKEAAGFDAARGDRIEIKSFPFVADDPPAIVAKPAARNLAPLVGGAGAALAAIAALLVVLRRRKRATAHEPSLALPAPIGEVERVLDHPAELGGDTAGALPPPRPLHDRVLEAVRADVPKAARVLSTWLTEQPPAARP